MTGLQFPTLKERVYYTLRDLIVTGGIPAGSQLDERELAERLQISRTPLREAISTLAREGVIEYRPYKGSFVRTFSAKDVRDLYEVRKALEALAVRLAVANLTEAGVEILLDVLREVQDAIDDNDLERLSEADQRFHATIAKLSGNHTLVDQLDRLGLQVQVVRSIANRAPGVVERTIGERQRILKAITRRDADRAVQLMEHHIEGVCAAVVSQLEGVVSVGGGVDGPH